jgi:beta-galactosidase/beta-glucuronidase
MTQEHEGLRTRWASQVNPDRVLPEYPRPQMVRRDWLNLNGYWEYAVRDAGDGDMGDGQGRILVPFPIESALSGVQRALLPHERLWYRRTFTVPDGWQGKRLLLHFGAVDWEARVWVNGRYAGSHTGGFCPFSFDITDLVAEGENTLTVSVWDPTDEGTQERGKQTLRPKGIFYTAVSGIWQTVWLEPVPQVHIASMRITPDLDRERVDVRVDIAGEAVRDGILEAAVFAGGSPVSADRATAAPLEGSGESRFSFSVTLPVPEPRPWSPESPFLYDLRLRLLAPDGGEIDRIDSYFGMRKFSVDTDERGKKRLFLNNRPYFHNGILDQGYWPDGLYTAPTDEALAYDVEMAKRMGYNMIRKHIKVEPARWYWHCDRIGMIVWQDMPNGGGRWNNLHHLILPNLVIGGVRVKDRPGRALGRHEPASRDHYRKELGEMIDALYNVTSIGVWVPFNEAWGQFNAAEMAEWVKRRDPTRTVDHASGWHDQGAGDIASLHIYFRKLAMPKPRRIRGRAVAITEYGGYSLNEPGHAWREGKEFGYRRMDSRERFEAAYASLIRDQLLPLLPQGVSAAVYTQLTDVETELNGMLTYDREVVKIDPRRLEQIHGEVYRTWENASRGGTGS